MMTLLSKLAEMKEKKYNHEWQFSLEKTHEKKKKKKWQS